MRYILNKKIFENKSELDKSILLNLIDNVDFQLIDKIKLLIPSGEILEISFGNGADALELSRI